MGDLKRKVIGRSQKRKKEKNKQFEKKKARRGGKGRGEIDRSIIDVIFLMGILGRIVIQNLQFFGFQGKSRVIISN